MDKFHKIFTPTYMIVSQMFSLYNIDIAIA